MTLMFGNSVLHVRPGFGALGEIVIKHIGAGGHLHGSLQSSLVFRRQGIEGLLVDQELHVGGRLMPAGIVVGGDLMEAHLDVHARSNPFQGIDGAAVKRGVEFARRRYW